MNTDSNPIIAPLKMLRPKRKIVGMSAILLPFDSGGQVDWFSFAAHVERTADSGLTPAINMDTGYANLLDDKTRREALRLTQSVMNGREFVAGAYVSDQPDASFDRTSYANAIEELQEFGGTPIIFQSYGLAHGSENQVVANYQQLGQLCDRFLAFELGTMFAPFGNIYSLDVYRELVAIPQCVGAKHSSLQREVEWQRLEIRDEVRPEFMVLTGNDLAIDMVMYGSDYLLGLSTFCPDVFAIRDRMWEQGDAGFYQLNDVLQYLGFFAFRNPTSAYKHSAAMFLNQRGWIKSDLTHSESPNRPASDRDVLGQIGRQLGIEMEN